MTGEELRAFAEATERMARGALDGGVDAGLVREAVERAAENPVEGLGRVSGLALVAGVDPYEIAGASAALDVSDANAVELDPEEREAFRAFYDRAARHGAAG